jgi:hypothetical protein
VFEQLPDLRLVVGQEDVTTHDPTDQPR